jgi:hypothetical protein
MLALTLLKTGSGGYLSTCTSWFRDAPYLKDS